MPAAALMILGTASNVGKSWVCTALCRSLARRGYSVAPFKAQNLSNNAAPARTASGGWGEIGRAQAAQADAAGVPAHVDMNPLLLKPTLDRGCQVVVLGKPSGMLSQGRSAAQHAEWTTVVHRAYDRLADRHDIIVLEGAGSPAEINLQQRDLVNMSMATHAISRATAGGLPGGCLLVGDIERGGVFASLYGTLALLPVAERSLFRGVIINRFRGDPRYLEPGPALFEARAGVPVRGVLPYRPDIAIDAEDAEDIVSSRVGELDICVLQLPTVSNFTDTAALAAEAGVAVRYVSDNVHLGNPDLLILPGAKDTLAALSWLRQTGLDRGVCAAAARGIPILGLCGGYQLLGEQIADPAGIGGASGTVAGLGLLPVRTVFSEDKAVYPVKGETCGGWLLPAGLPVSGYEIHQGRTAASGQPLLSLHNGPDGAIEGLVAGTYLHGVLDGAAVRRALLDTLRSRRALPPCDGPGEDAATFRSRQYDAAADLIEARLDLSGLLP